MRPTEALSIHHCLCPCTKELWVLLMHLLEHRHKVLHRQVKTSTHLFAGAVKYESVHFPTDRSLLPLVFLELHEFPAEASGFRGASSRAVQRPPHTVQGPAHVHVVARRPRSHVGSVQSQRHSSDRGKKHYYEGFVECKYQHMVNRATLRTYTFTPGKTPVTHLEEFTFSLVCLYMILHLKLLQFSNLDVTQELIHEFSSDFTCIAITQRNIQHTYIV